MQVIVISFEPKNAQKKEKHLIVSFISIVLQSENLTKIWNQSKCL